MLNSSALTFEGATGKPTKQVIKSDDPNEGDLDAGKSQRLSGGIKVTRSVPHTGEAKVAEFKEGWTMPING